MAERLSKVKNKTTKSVNKSSGKVSKDIFVDTKNPVCVRNTTGKGELYFITRHVHDRIFRLWHKIDTGYELVSESDSPVDFDDLIPW